MVDLSAVFGLAAGLAADLIETAGTTISISRPGPPGTVNADTLTITPATATVIAVSVPAIVVALASRGSSEPFPGEPRYESAYQVLVRPDVVDVADGDLATVTTCLDLRLLGRTLVVDGVPDSSAGAVRVLSARLLPTTGGVR